MWSSLPFANWPSHLPALSEGETIYSWCATFHRKCLGSSALQTSRALFGHPYAALLHDFPSHLDEFTRRTNGVFGESNRLALRHTLLGYYLAFKSEEQAERLLQSVQAGSNPHLKMHLGIPASGVGGYHPLRCCKDCIDRDRLEMGWPVWHVHHQAPSTLTCSWHYRPLVQTWHRATPVHRREWLVPDAKLNLDRIELSIVGKDAERLLECMSKLSSHAFNLTPGSCSSTKLTQTYRRWAKDNDVMTREAHVRGSRAVDILAPRFSQIRKSLQSLGPVACDFSLRATIENVFRETTRPLHPLKHIVLLTAMFQDADRILEELMKEPTPQADYHPDPAPSKVLPQHKTEDIELLNRFKELTGKGYSVNAASELLGVSTYIGVRWAKTHDIYFTPRSKSMQPEVQDAVRGALRAGQGKTEWAAAGCVDTDLSFLSSLELYGT